MQFTEGNKGNEAKAFLRATKPLEIKAADAGFAKGLLVW
jgi:hypothetical protein